MTLTAIIPFPDASSFARTICFRILRRLPASSSIEGKTMKKIFSMNRFEGWNLSLPLIQGGMGVGVSLSGLAGAVASEGGMGVISTAQIGFEEPDFALDQRQTQIPSFKTIH